ncbi:hypothetical protein D3C80_1519170 [compost metagenome]
MKRFVVLKGLQFCICLVGIFTFLELFSTNDPVAKGSYFRLNIYHAIGIHHFLQICFAEFLCVQHIWANLFTAKKYFGFNPFAQQNSTDLPFCHSLDLSCQINC